MGRIKRDTKKYSCAYLNVVLCEGNWKDVAQVRQQSKEILQKEAMGVSIRLRFKENAETEKASLFHLNLNSSRIVMVN